MPRERLGGVFMITDGVVDDIPADASALGFKAPLHALSRGHEGERDRRIELLEAPRFGIVGKEQTIELRVLDTAATSDPVVLKVRRDGNPIATIVATPGERLRVPVKIEHGGPNVVELEVETLPDELTAINNKAVLTIEGVRDKLKVLLVSGNRTRARPASGAIFSNPAPMSISCIFTILRPAGEAGWNADQRIVADRLSDRGSLRPERDQGIRPHASSYDRYSDQSVLPLILFR